MPIYQYLCADCAATLERRQHFSDAPLTECPSCGGTLRKVLQPVGVIFKGSGWYCTDSKPKSSSESGSDGSSSKPKSAEVAA